MPTPTQRILAAVLAACLLGLYWYQAVSASAHWSQTSDELPHLTAGYAYDRFNDYRMHSENGNLPQRVHGLAPLALGAQFPMDEARWRKSDYWQLGWDFLYGLSNPTDRMLLGARALNALFGVGLGLFIFLVARTRYGDAGGLLTLGFYAFCPNFLAHAALATSDLAGSLALPLAAWLFWRHLGRRDFTSGALAGAASGFALVAKFNGVLLAPLYAGLALADAWLRTDTGRASRVGRNLLLGGAQALAGAAVIWACFGFRYDVAGPGTPPVEKMVWDWHQMTGGIGFKGRVLVFLADHHLLPYGWLFGLANVLAGEVARPAFFAGEYSLHGWRSFFPTLFLTKTPLAFLTALLVTGAAGLLAWRRADPAARRAALAFWAPLGAVTLLVGATAIASNLNIGHRHLLPAYPALFVAVGGLFSVAGRTGRVLAGLLLLGQATESLSIRPHYLAFFNPLAGGSERAHRLVVDSSLDWGQALPALREWLATHRRPEERVYLSYFGSAWPPNYGVRPTHFLPAVTIATPAQAPYAYRPGLYCLSATSLAEVYSPYRGPWRASWERRLRDPATPMDEAALLRFSRLCKYLQSRQPDAHAGYAILIYRLDATELDVALRGPVKGW